MLLQHQVERVLNGGLELLHELTTNSAIDNLVVERTGDDDLVIPLDAILALGGDGNLLDGTNSDDAGLGRVDDSGESVNGSVHAHVGDGDGTTLVLLRLELAVTGALAEGLDLAGDGLETGTVDVLDNGGHETDRCCNSDRNVNSVVLTDEDVAVLLAPAGVGGRDLTGSNGESLDEEVVDRELVLAVGG